MAGVVVYYLKFKVALRFILDLLSLNVGEGGFERRVV